MLRELPMKKQAPGDNNRRWFFCNKLDLVVWFDDDGNPVGFQLAYDKYRNEHSISWHRNGGFVHYVVDEGNPKSGKAETPLLHANGAFNAAPVIGLFRSLSAEMPQHIARFVIEKLSAYLADGSAP